WILTSTRKNLTVRYLCFENKYNQVITMKLFVSICLKMVLSLLPLSDAARFCHKDKEIIMEGQVFKICNSPCKICTCENGNLDCKPMECSVAECAAEK
ncbi:hypothetical protein Btru_042248, partial [Bulinus truncatus]